jgi:hypothetical protein
MHEENFAVSEYLYGIREWNDITLPYHTNGG